MPRTKLSVVTQESQVEEPMLTAPQVAKRLGFSRSQIYAWVAEQAIPHYKIQGNSVRFDWNEVRAWRDRQRVPVAQ